MNSMFTVQYFEVIVGEYLERHTNGSILIPASAQEKGIDLVLYKNEGTVNKMTTIQVKSSRPHPCNTKKSKTLPLDKNTSQYPMQYLFFNRYEVEDNAEWFIIGGDYFKHDDDINTKSNAVTHTPIMLAFTREEMIEFFDNCVKVKDPTKKDDKFDFLFDENKNIYQCRGCVVNGKKSYRNMNKYLIENRLDEIINSMH